MGKTKQKLKLAEANLAVHLAIFERIADRVGGGDTDIGDLMALPSRLDAMIAEINRLMRERRKNRWFCVHCEEEGPAESKMLARQLGIEHAEVCEQNTIRIERDALRLAAAHGEPLPAEPAKD